MSPGILKELSEILGVSIVPLRPIAYAMSARSVEQLRHQCSAPHGSNPFLNGAELIVDERISGPVAFAIHTKEALAEWLKDMKDGKPLYNFTSTNL